MKRQSTDTKILYSYLNLEKYPFKENAKEIKKM